MKHLAHKIIIYDDSCPLCKAYTEGFVQLGWLPLENRVGFSQVPQSILDQIDIDRARHEIPLFDTATGQTIYGKDALFFIIGEQFPLFKPLFNFSIFRGFIFGLYQIITYNRRIIAGSPKLNTGFDCAPDFNAFYRWLYIGLCTICSIFILSGFNQAFTDQWQIVLGLFGAGLLRGLFYSGLKKRTDYFGHYATVILIVSLVFGILGFNQLTVIAVPLLGMYLWTKRIVLLSAST